MCHAYTAKIRYGEDCDLFFGANNCDCSGAQRAGVNRNVEVCTKYWCTGTPDHVTRPAAPYPAPLPTPPNLFATDRQQGKPSFEATTRSITMDATELWDGELEEGEADNDDDDLLVVMLWAFTTFLAFLGLYLGFASVSVSFIFKLKVGVATLIRSSVQAERQYAFFNKG